MRQFVSLLPLLLNQQTAVPIGLLHLDPSVAPANVQTRPHPLDLQTNGYYKRLSLFSMSNPYGHTAAAQVNHGDTTLQMIPTLNPLPFHPILPS